MTILRNATSYSETPKDSFQKYLKYKNKYLALKKISSGGAGAGESKDAGVELSKKEKLKNEISELGTKIYELNTLIKKNEGGGYGYRGDNLRQLNYEYKMAKRNSVNRSYAVEKQAKQDMIDIHWRIVDVKEKIENYKKKIEELESIKKLKEEEMKKI